MGERQVMLCGGPPTRVPIREAEGPGGERGLALKGGTGKDILAGESGLSLSPTWPRGVHTPLSLPPSQQGRGDCLVSQAPSGAMQCLPRACSVTFRLTPAHVDGPPSDDTERARPCPGSIASEWEAELLPYAWTSHSFLAQETHLYPESRGLSMGLSHLLPRL